MLQKYDIISEFQFVLQLQIQNKQILTIDFWIFIMEYQKHNPNKSEIVRAEISRMNIGKPRTERLFQAGKHQIYCGQEMHAYYY